MSNLISGNVGTAGILVTLSGAANNTTTSANDGSYSFTGLSNGVYLVTPSLLGATFTPVDRAVTIASADQTGISFTFTPPTSVFGNPQKLINHGPLYPSTVTALTVTANQAIRDLIVVSVTASGLDNASGVTVTDTIGNTYTHLPTTSEPGSGFKNQLWYCLSSIGTNANNVISANISGGSVNVQMFVWYCSVTAGAVVTFDAAPTPKSTANTTSPTSSNTFNTAGFDEIIFSACTSSTNGATAFSAGTNQTFDATQSMLAANVGTSTLNAGYEHFRLFGSTSSNSTSMAFNNGTQTGTVYVAAAFYGALTSFTIAGRTIAGTTLSLTGTSTGTAVADSTGAYSFASLAPGSYVVTPHKLGFSFSPASASITITTANVTQNFTGLPAGRTTSTYTLQNEIDKVVTLADLEPIYNVGGYTNEPFVTIATDVFTAICGVNFPHKWNEVQLPVFYTNSWQQDYALVNPDGSSVYNVEWLERGTAIGINTNQGGTKPYARIECGRAVSSKTGANSSINALLNDPAFIVASFLNAELYYGVWGQPNVGSATWGNNPVANSVYTAPLGNQSQPNNPITQIIDANGNLLVLTTYGHEGSAAPVLPINSLPGLTVSGTGATTVWTVVDPAGLGIRIVDVPPQTGMEWQMNIWGQMPPVKFVNLQQTLSPLPDKYEPYFRAGLIAQLYRYSPLEKARVKFKDEWALWLKSLQELKQVQDRELEEYGFVTERTIMGVGRRRNNYRGAGNPYYPGT